jgi:hypothetical protein
MPAYERFQTQANAANAINASIYAWQVHDWIWHEEHAGEDTQNNLDYTNFRKDRFRDCPDLALIRDVADAGKHRGLGRSDAEVRRVAGQTHIFRRITGPDRRLRRTVWTTPLLITLTDGSTQGFADVLARVIAYWRDRYFP